MYMNFCENFNGILAALPNVSYLEINQWGSQFTPTSYYTHMRDFNIKYVYVPRCTWKRNQVFQVICSECHRVGGILNPKWNAVRILILVENIVNCNNLSKSFSNQSNPTISKTCYSQKRVHFLVRYFFPKKYSMKNQSGFHHLVESIFKVSHVLEFIVYRIKIRAFLL